MGRDKALLELGGVPLVAHAVTKLRRLCAEVRILSGNPKLAAFGPLVGDAHPGCGPLGGIEAALLGSACEWNLIVPVDVPLLPTAWLEAWIRSVLRGPVGELRLAMVDVDAVAQPTLLIVHREIGAYLTEALERGKYKLLPALESAAAKIAEDRGVQVEKVFRRGPWDDFSMPLEDGAGEAWRVVTAAQRLRPFDWFANLNTPEEFREAEGFVGALDTL